MKAFISYCHHDKSHFDRFKVHLATLKRNKLIDDWSDKEIQAGQNIEQQIRQRMKSAELFVMLVSPDFLDSKYCIEKELQFAIERQNIHSTVIVPIIIEPCDWESIPELSSLKVLPEDGKPVSIWENPNTAWLDVIKELKRILVNQKPKPKNSEINQLNIKSRGVFTANEWWLNWVTKTKPKLTTSIVSKRHFDISTELLNRITNKDPEISIMGETKEEAIAFTIATIIENADKNLTNRAFVVKCKDVNIEPIPGKKSILIFDLPDKQEPHLGDRNNFIIVHPFHKGELNVQNPIRLSHIPAENFYKELKNIGLTRQRVNELQVKSGNSLPALRRLLSKTQV